VCSEVSTRWAHGNTCPATGRSGGQFTLTLSLTRWAISEMRGWVMFSLCPWFRHVDAGEIVNYVCAGFVWDSEFCWICFAGTVGTISLCAWLMLELFMVNSGFLVSEVSHNLPNVRAWPWHEMYSSRLSGPQVQKSQCLCLVMSLCRFQVTHFCRCYGKLHQKAASAS